MCAGTSERRTRGQEGTPPDLTMRMKEEKVRQLGAALMGLGLIFFGMELMSEAMKPLRIYAPFIDLMQQMKNPFLGILIGMVFTALVQSSSATTGIVIVLAGQGFISLEAGIALLFGANIGTCVTALLAAIGKPREALQGAMVHVLFNVVGVVLWVGFIRQLAGLVRAVSPTSLEPVGRPGWPRRRRDRSPMRIRFSTWPTPFYSSGSRRRSRGW